MVSPKLLVSLALCAGPALALTPVPQTLTKRDGAWPLRGQALTVRVAEGPEHDACALVLADALRLAGAAPRVQRPAGGASDAFSIGEEGVVVPSPPQRGAEAYGLAIGPAGAGAVAASPAGLLHAAQTFRQLARRGADEGRVRCVAITDYPEFAIRGIYIEGGQERFGRIVEKDYLIEQIHRLAEFKMNTLVIECYNLFPFPSFADCADAGTLSPADCRELVAEAKRYHVTLVPSLQTLAQAWELVWANDGGKPYREVTAPGMMCPSTPETYTLIRGLYRDLLDRFGDTPLLGIGCSEIDMQWQSRFCPRCQERVATGATTRDLLLGHAEKCIAAVREVAAELGRPVRPLMWGDEFYMYGPGRDWEGIERIPRDTVMGHWKYWADYAGIGGLLQRGYDVLGVSAMYNHSFYLADLSPELPKKAWAPMEQTGVRNITEMAQEARRVTGLPDAAGEPRRGRFLGTATASFSKHRLRAFDSIWYGFALNAHCAWSGPERPLRDYQSAFTRAFVRHYYDCRTSAAARTLAEVYEGLDQCKSRLELANQTLCDVVGVYDTQEPGYTDNTLAAALIGLSGEPTEELARIRDAAMTTMAEAGEAQRDILACQGHVGQVGALADLWLAGEKIAAHAEREALMVDTQASLVREESPKRAIAASLARRWHEHRRRMERVLRRTQPLYQRGDPCGLAAMLQDIRAVEAHLERLGQGDGLGEESPGRVLLEERFGGLDTARWIIRGQPEVADGRLQTAAPGGWENYCGLTTRQAFALEEQRPLTVTFEVTPTKPGISSPLFASGTPNGDLDYRFCFFGRTDRFAVYTQLATMPSGQPVPGEAGWHPRGQSSPFQVGATYRVRAEITRRSFRIMVSEAGASPWGVPLWDSGAIPMDDLTQTRLLFSAVEPPQGSAACRWGAIVVTGGGAGSGGAVRGD